MKCTIEFNGQKFDSANFTERHVTGFIAGLGAWGINLKEFFEQIFSSEVSTANTWHTYAGSAFREFDMEQADRNLSYLIRTVFPGMVIEINDLDTSDLLAIVTPMVTTWAAELRAAKTADAQTASNEQVSPGIYGDDLELDYPQESPELATNELHAIGYAARTMNHSFALIHCWYQWFKMFQSLDGTEINIVDILDLIVEQSPVFNKVDSDRYYAIIQAYLKESKSPETVSA